MDMQLQDKLLTYKRDMGLLPASTSGDAQQALPAEGETGAGGQRSALLDNSGHNN
jgi:hypothetical protein